MSTAKPLREQLRYRLWPHNFATVPQPRWYDILRYGWAQYVDLDRVKMTLFPETNRGYQYVCPHCDRTFPNHYTRNVHEWREHPGCPKYRIELFWEWVYSKQGSTHSCRCRPEDCEQGCFPGGPFRR